MTKKEKRRNTVLLASLIFGMFFGAGNLIFPVQLGQNAGSNWVTATLGFLITGTLVPFLAMLAVSVTNSKGVYDVAKPVAPWFAAVFLVLLHLTIGPFFGTPRTAATAFSMGAAPFLPKNFQGLGMLIFSALFFSLAYFLTIKQKNLVKWIGKYLNPLFLALLVIVLLLALVLPMGSLHQAVQPSYSGNPFFQGFLDGYNTMDGLALLAFAVTVVYAVRGLGYQKEQVPKMLAKSGFFSILAEAVLYAGLVFLGTSSLGLFKVAANGGTAFAQIVQHFLGNVGIVFTGVLVTLAVFTTAMGLCASFAQDMHRTFPKLSYATWLKITTVGSLVTANAGLTNIVAWAIPVLMLMYPLALVLIGLSLCAKFFKRSKYVCRSVVFMTLPAALLDSAASLPTGKLPVLSDLVTAYHQSVPLASLGLGWLLPALVGAVVGTCLYLLFDKGQRAAVSQTEAN
ncbi:branched-chain amino acid transport system II carrier protein [Oenococcus kitaharae]|uniref:Branched-chain amino acid transport system carrier protein n=1 Tax=Oenococcus kitaharae DSM 17330 TaxID=1045004 RepID=G9WIF8_9LACO|nr:branched-chain amino acid transport system II carrier protein [Oenococcus kitaharae]EHN58970.1 Branched-chain amino acid transport system carrier protein [Oenococcus kitaharae DSM 17330]OEY81720.1 branched-chain amino acid transporter II carrier protein [Oenococcus kitaharae]OEY83951.1 branched-chain amino acid transporter II carrier protein [Oenococcus kitaharae]OEY85693.1 branched-chain amino acid transporter II carrier protein [Oenococcus kitaharae]